MKSIEQEIISNPSKVAGKSITQVLAMLGDGTLTDNGTTAFSFRDFLSNCELEQLGSYANEMISQGSDGKIFQDIVNTIGKKIGFQVAFGFYKGRKNAIGYDGHWSFGDLNLIIECKTTDAYRISTDTLLKYSRDLKIQKNLNKEPPVLLVVGRVDTGDIEAQIRGSRADDQISVIGVESLLGLAKAQYELSGGPAAESLRSLLFPRDYTRLDDLTALVTNVINETQQTTLDQAEHIVPLATETGGAQEPLSKKENNKVPSEKLRSKMIATLTTELGHLEKASSRSVAQYKTINGEVYFFLVSKRYARSDQQFWYSVQNSWQGLWEENGGGLAIGLEGKSHFYIFDHSQVLEWAKDLNETISQERRYWHMALKESSDKLEIILNRSGTLQDLREYEKSFIET